MTKSKTVFIVGAGFSANAGVPLQSGFTKEFLRAEDFTHGKSRHLMGDLHRFVQETFGFDAGGDLTFYPELEDIFTTLDLSANTGHHLGCRYSPKELRRVRRMLLSRIIRMLNSAYLDGKEENRTERQLLLKLISQLSEKKHQFVSLNWDVVLEGCLEETGAPFTPHYSREIRPAQIRDDKIIRVSRGNRQLHVAKMHGSINWLYCDCCRRSYSVPVHQVSRLASQVLKNEEEEEIYGEKARPRLVCPSCGVDLGVRLATFSYQKALRAPIFESSWLQAEKSLRRAGKWIFIGYSLPAADFEFKYLLKRVELARKYAPQIVVVTKASTDTPETSPTVISYKRFFGKNRPTFFYGGLTDAGINEILSD